MRIYDYYRVTNIYIIIIGCIAKYLINKYKMLNAQ